LNNFRAVYDYRVDTLKGEKEPLMDHLKNMENNVKIMFDELLDEAHSQKRIESKI